MAKVTAWMPLWIGDYLADTMHLTATQHGAYLLLIMAHWRRPEGLPNDSEFLRQTARMTPEEWASEAQACLAFFTEKDGVLTHKRVVEEQSKAVAKHAKLSAAGRKGGKSGLSEAKARLKQSQSQSHNNIHTIRRGWKLEEVEAAGAMASVRPEVCRLYFDSREAVGWVDRNGNPISSMPHDLARFRNHYEQIERQKEEPKTAKFNGQQKPSEGVWHLEKRIEAATKEIDRIQANPSNKEQIPDSFDRRLKAEPMAKVKQLKASISEMRQRLAGVEVAA